MSALDWVLAVIAFGNMLQAYYWASVCNRLENKLMSRDFNNYIETQRPVIPRTNFKLPPDEIDLNREIQPF